MVRDSTIPYTTSGVSVTFNIVAMRRNAEQSVTILVGSVGMRVGMENEPFHGERR